MDTLDLANDYVNLEWEEFEKKHGEELLPFTFPLRPVTVGSGRADYTFLGVWVLRCV